MAVNRPRRTTENCIFFADQVLSEEVGLSNSATNDEEGLTYIDLL